MDIKKLSWILIGGVVFVVLAYVAILIFLTWPISELSVSKSGVFGDSFGLLTSLFSGLAFAGLIITIAMQREELALQRQELNLTREELHGQRQEMHHQNETLKIQRFENTFFKMLEFMEVCRSDVFCQGFRGRSLQGRDAIKFLYEDFISGYLSYFVEGKNFQSTKVFRKECRNREGIAIRYNIFYVKYGDALGQYYRTLYNALKLVDCADFIQDKKFYTNLVRAQLSRYELLLLFYNCLSDYGQGKMAPLVRKYEILKHLESGMLPKENYDIFSIFNA